jgi:hypothetical protein
MPRRHRRAPETRLPRPGRPRSAAPAWAEIGGHEVRVVHGDKPYRCPGCEQLVRAGTAHFVVVPLDDPDARRHWHTGCWRSELRRLGILRRNQPDDLD